MVSRDSVFPPPASGLASWPPQCPDETPHFNGFLAPEYASQPTVKYCKALSFPQSTGVGYIRKVFLLASAIAS